MRGREAGVKGGICGERWSKSRRCQRKKKAFFCLEVRRRELGVVMRSMSSGTIRK